MRFSSASLALLTFGITAFSDAQTSVTVRGTVTDAFAVPTTR